MGWSVPPSRTDPAAAAAAAAIVSVVRAPGRARCHIPSPLPPFRRPPPHRPSLAKLLLFLVLAVSLPSGPGAVAVCSLDKYDGLA